MAIVSVVARFRAHPIATALELGSVLVCVCLFVATFAVLATAPPERAATPWLAIVGVGAAFVLFWTAIVPLYERTL